MDSYHRWTVPIDCSVAEEYMGVLTVGDLSYVRKAREDFLSDGIIPVGIVNETIFRSWQRSAERGIGMERDETRCVPRYDLMQRRDINNTFLLRSQPVMENLYHEICAVTGSYFTPSAIRILSIRRRKST